jgi:hypothetical protein
MQDSFSQLILNEIREIKTDVRALNESVNETTRALAERMATAESQLHSLLGNGQPGRLAKVEADVSALKKWRWQVTGMCTAVGAIAGFLLKVVVGH